MQWLCKTWQRHGFTVLHARPNQLRRRREVLENSCIQKKSRRSIYTDNSPEFIRACEELNRKHDRSTPRRFETHGIAERAARRGTSSFCSGWTGQKQWSVSAVSETCKTNWQMARRLVDVGSIDHLVGRLFFLKQKSTSITDHQKTKVECISSAQKSFLENSWDTP